MVWAILRTLARVIGFMPGRECSARSTVPIETSRAFAISLIPTGLRLFLGVEEPLLFPRILRTLMSEAILTRVTFIFQKNRVPYRCPTHLRQASDIAANDSLGRAQSPALLMGSGGNTKAEFLSIAAKTPSVWPA